MSQKFVDIANLIRSKLVFTKDLEVSGIKFGLGLLSLEEEQKSSALSTATNMEDTMTYYNEIRRGLLSFAVKALNGEVLPDVLEVEGGTKERAIYIRELLATLPSKIIDQLFEAYVDLREEAESKLDSTVAFQWYKTPAQREEERKVKESEAAKKAEDDSKKEEENIESKDIKLTPIPKPDDEETPAA